MQSAYFSYPRDFVGYHPSGPLSIGGERPHADFRATLGKVPGADRTSPELHAITAAPERRAASEVRSRLRFGVTSRSHLSPRDESFSELFARRPALTLPSLLYPSLFIVPLRISALSAVLPRAPSPCDPAVPVQPRRLRKVFLCGPPPVCSRCDSCCDLAHYAK